MVAMSPSKQQKRLTSRELQWRARGERDQLDLAAPGQRDETIACSESAQSAGLVSQGTGEDPDRVVDPYGSGLDVLLLRVDQEPGRREKGDVMSFLFDHEAGVTVGVHSP